MVRGIALLLTVLTGFSGLVYQVAWQRYLAVLLGSHAEATAAVLGIFLGGLSLGYALFGRVTRGIVQDAHRRGQPARLLFSYGLVEAGIGAWALLFPLLFAGVQTLSLSLPHGSEAVAFGVDVALTALLIGPPTILMGGTIPILTQGLSHGLEDATRFHSFVYAFNTAGAFTGALAAGFWLVPELGLRGAVLAMGGVNLLAGLVFLVLGRTGERVDEAESRRASGELPARFAVYATAAGLSGFAMMALQTAFNRVGALALGGSHLTFAMVVATFVLSIALGSLAVSLLPRIRPSYLIVSQWLLVALLLASYPVVQDAPYWAHVVRVGFPSDAAAFHPFYFRIFLWGLAFLLLPIGLSGATLPLIFHHLRREVADLGGVAGRLYAWNTVGSLLGALLGGYALLSWLDLHQTYRLAIACLGVGAALLTAEIARSGRTWGPFALIALLATLVLLPAWQPEKLSAGLFRERDGDFSGAGPNGFLELFWAEKALISYDDDPTTSVAVVEHADGPQAGIAIYNTGKSDGHIPGDNTTMGLAALLPTLLHPDPQVGFIIGQGTGFTIGALAVPDSIREVWVAEISSAVIAAGTFFEPFNGGAAESPKTRIRRSDAYRGLLRDDRRYDVIVSEPSNPWMAGNEMLFTRDFLEAARSRLTPQGIYTQWIHTYAMNDATLALVLRTYLSVFDRVSVWYSDIGDLLILGFADEDFEVDLERAAARFDRSDYATKFEQIGIDSFASLLVHELVPIEVLSELKWYGPIHTSLSPVLGYQSARAFFEGGKARLPRTTARDAAIAGARNSLAGRYLASLSAEDRIEALGDMAEESCDRGEDQCVAFMARWRRDTPGSPRLSQALARLRGRSPEDMQSLSEANLDYFGLLYEPRGIEGISDSYENAVQVRNLFDSLYSHAVPFDARALWSAWERCRWDLRCSIELGEIRRTGAPPR